MTRTMQTRAGGAGRLISCFALACAGLLACGGGAPPSERLVNAEAAIRGAIEINANAAPPRAALHLQLAQEQVDAMAPAISKLQGLEVRHSPSPSGASDSLACASPPQDTPAGTADGAARPPAPWPSPRRSSARHRSASSAAGRRRGR